MKLMGLNIWLWFAWCTIVGQAVRFGWLAFKDGQNAPADQWVTTEHLWPFLAMALASFFIVVGGRQS